ncbi:MAG: LytTR family DNA-binding domain-containing protein [Bacteroidales bacterium]|nr:LytTR family DNA-binding domain-containing protein [Bacteroidales bacterium]
MIKCIAIDDESLALRQLCNYIEKTPYLQLMGRFDNAIEAIGFLQENAVDLMFVDIEMPELNGMDFVKSLNHPPKVIFITAYSQFAIEGFRVNAVDYLLKPIGYADFLKAADKVKPTGTLEQVQNATEEDENIFVKTGTKHIRINLNDILFVEGMREYLKIILKDGSSIVTLMSMKKATEVLSEDKFMRVHRSYIINLKYFTTLDRNRIIYNKDTYIPISEQYLPKVKKYVEENSLKK